jgi:hypothetical protein
LNPQRTEGGGFLDVPPDPSLACSVGASINGDASLDAATPFDASAARDASP